MTMSGYVSNVMPWYVLNALPSSSQTRLIAFTDATAK